MDVKEEHLFVVAAGNGGGDQVGDELSETPSYPAAYPLTNMIVVGAADAVGELTPYSNFGSSVDLVAESPYGSSFATVPVAVTAAFTRADDLCQEYQEADPDERYFDEDRRKKRDEEYFERLQIKIPRKGCIRSCPCKKTVLAVKPVISAETSKLSPTFPKTRHCEARSDEAISSLEEIASLRSQ